jgi:hypothetical protein
MSTKIETSNIRSNSKVRVPWVALLIVLVLVVGGAAVLLSLGSAAGGNMLTQTLQEPLGGITTAKIEIDPGDGNLTLDRLAGGEAVLASGTLQYPESKGPATHELNLNGTQPTFTLKSAGGQPWLNVPWAACNGASEWQVHLNPGVLTDLTAHTDGGNLKLNLSGMAISRVSADTGGGNVEVVLPDKAANLAVTAKTGGGNVTVELGQLTKGVNTVEANSGAGNVVVRLPAGIAARIQAASGIGKVNMDARFQKIDDKTYQTTGYDTAEDRVTLTLNSGAGNVEIQTK